MPMPVSGQVGEQSVGPGVTSQPLRQGPLADVIVTELMGRYYELARNKRLFLAYATVTAPVAFSTAAGTGGPLIWNPPTSGVNVVPLAIGLSTSVVTTVAGGIGLTGGTGQTAAPTTTTAIDASGNANIGGATGAAKPFRIGTVTVPGALFLPFIQVHTGALTVDNTGLLWVDVGGLMIVPPSAWCSVAGSATLSTLVAQIGLLYAEVPVA